MTSETGGTGTGLSVRVKQWRTALVWTWNAGDSSCGICHSPFDACPPDSKFPGDDSPVVWGTCSHAFHLQCIQRWLNSHTDQRCPYCRRDWVFQH